MNTEIIVAAIGAASTILTALISLYTPVKERKERSEQEGMKPTYKTYRREIVIMLSAFLVGVAIVAVTWVLTNNFPVAEKKLVGHYKDRKPDNSEYFTDDHLSIRIFKDNTVTGTSSSIVEEQDGPREKKYRVQGYDAGDSLVLSYVTDEPNPRGIGAYVLERAGESYVGYGVLRDKNGFYRVPYASEPDREMRNHDYWLKQWPKLFDQSVAQIELNPDRPGMANADLRVSIDAPREQEELPVKIVIRGTLKGKPQQGRFLWVVTHPHESQGSWWPQGGRLDAIEGQWSIRAGLGKEKDAGANFDIAVISVAEEDDKAYTEYLRNGGKNKSYPAIALPKSAEVITKITVRRMGGRPYAAAGAVMPYESTRVDNRNPSDYLQPWQVRERGRR